MWGLRRLDGGNCARYPLTDHSRRVHVRPSVHRALTPKHLFSPRHPFWWAHLPPLPSFSYPPHPSVFFAPSLGLRLALCISLVTWFPTTPDTDNSRAHMNSSPVRYILRFSSFPAQVVSCFTRFILSDKNSIHLVEFDRRPPTLVVRRHCLPLISSVCKSTSIYLLLLLFTPYFHLFVYFLYTNTCMSPIDPL